MFLNVGLDLGFGEKSELGNGQTLFRTSSLYFSIII